MYQKLGTITNFLQKSSIAIVLVEKPIKLNQKIRIRGPQNDFVQEIKEMQLKKQDIKEAKPKQTIGLKLDQKASKDDEIVTW